MKDNVRLTRSGFSSLDHTTHVRPVVTDVGVSLDDKGRDAQGTQASRNHQAVLTATDNENGWVGLLELDLLLAL